MRSTSPFIIGDKGFVFPFVLLVSAAIFILFFTAIQLYETEQKMTKNLLGHLQVETIYQMSLHELKEEFSIKNPGVKNAKRAYHYPQGEAKISLHEKSATIYSALFSISTDNGVSYNFSQPLIIPPRDDSLHD